MLIVYLESWDSIYLSKHTKDHVEVEKRSLKIVELEMHSRVNTEKSNAFISGWIDDENVFLMHKGMHFNCEEKWNYENHGQLGRAGNNNSE